MNSRPRDALDAQLIDALEVADTEPGAHVAVTRAMGAISADLLKELLLSDASKAHLQNAAQHPTRGAPRCAVDSPFSCIPVRRSVPMTFEDSRALNAGPELHGGTIAGPGSANPVSRKRTEHDAAIYINRLAQDATAAIEATAFGAHRMREGSPFKDQVSSPEAAAIARDLSRSNSQADRTSSGH